LLRFRRRRCFRRVLRELRARRDAWTREFWHATPVGHDYRVLYVGATDRGYGPGWVVGRRRGRWWKPVVGEYYLTSAVAVARELEGLR
jgi:hypothetical protein